MRKRLFSFALALIFALTLLPALSVSAASPLLGKTFKSVTIGGYSDNGSSAFTLAIETDGSLWTWGANEYGKLGDGTEERRMTPVKVMDDVVQVAAGSFSAMAVKSDNSLWSWGAGYLGDGETTRSLTPIKVMEDVASVSITEERVAIIKTDGSLWAFGNGPIGDGTQNGAEAPVKIMDDVAYVCAGRYATMAIKTDGTLWAWGKNYFGVLGNGTGEDSLVPVQIMADVATVSFHSSAAYAVKTDGNLWYWGSGIFGNGEKSDFYNPILKPQKGMADVVAVSSGSSSTMIIKKDGSLWGWGGGAIGDGVGGVHFEATKIMDHVAAVATGLYHTVAIKKDGSLWIWGDGNYDGALGDGTYISRPTPIPLSQEMPAPQTEVEKFAKRLETEYKIILEDVDGLLTGDSAAKYMQTIEHTLKLFTATYINALVDQMREVNMNRYLYLRLVEDMGSNVGYAHDSGYLTLAREGITTATFSHELAHMVHFALIRRDTNTRDLIINTFAAINGDQGFDEKWDKSKHGTTYVSAYGMSALLEDFATVVEMLVEDPGAAKTRLDNPANAPLREKAVFVRDVFYKLSNSCSAIFAPLGVPAGKKASPTASTVYVNGVPVAFEAYNIDGNNYFKLRDLSSALNGTTKQFEVGYDSATKAITLTNGLAYTAVGGELAAGDGTAKTASLTSSKIYLDGKELFMTVYMINGNNFFKLRDLMQAINVYVGYDAETKNITLDTHNGYME